VTVTIQLFALLLPLPPPLSKLLELVLESALPLEPLTAFAKPAPMLLPTLEAAVLLPSEAAPSEGMLPSPGPLPLPSELPGAWKLAQPAVLNELSVPSSAVGPRLTLPPSEPVAPGVVPGGCAK
jgi:hypothetical protein